MPRLSTIRKQALDEIMKEALYEATVEVLSDHGVDGMTMDRVAVAAGVAKGSLYRYFRGKRELLEFVHAKIIDPLFQDLNELVVATGQPAVAKLAAHLHTLLEHVAKHAQVFRLLFDDDAAQDLLQSSERCTRKAAGQRMAEIFRQGIAEGVFRPVDPLVLANMYLGVCKAVLESRPVLQTREEREEVHRLIMGAFLNGIATDQGRSG
jgi:AcrR family transcriptional regulator